MVCVRCETIVKSELKKIGLPYKAVRLGEIEIDDDLSFEKRDNLNVHLEKLGMGLLDDKKKLLVEKIKNLVTELIHYTDYRIKINLSDYLKEKLAYDYAYLSRLFAEVNGTTIENYFISLRVERAKEMLVYEDLSIIEIAEKLHFSDASHFTNQFKKVTGLTPSYFKHIKNKRLNT